MGIRVLNDPAMGHAALYDSITGIPLAIEIFSDAEPGGAFVDAADAAVKFAEDATAAIGRDLRTVDPAGLRAYQARWFKENLPGEEWSVKHAGE